VKPVAQSSRHNDRSAAGLRLLTIVQVCERVSLARRSVYDAVKAGRFPRQVQLSPGRVAWVEDEIDAWLSDRIAARGSK
jgi:prophage regulatory protein